MRLFKSLGISLAASIISLLLGLALNNPPAVIGITLGVIFVASLVLSFFLYLFACEALAKAKGYNPVIIATVLLGLIPPLILLLVLPDISKPGAQ
ncbi:MAG: hypothetical protein JWQ04_2282 [Pedosphaera sp.]|nr:hypothetical protein [Pedosphaera sp.]